MNKKVGAVGLEHLLLLAAAVELSLNRLAVPTLRPHGDTPPPTWHRVLDHAALFFQYFTTTLVVATLGYMLVRILRSPSRPRKGVRSVPGYATVLTGAALLVVAGIYLASSPGATLSFVFEALFAVTLVLIIFDQMMTSGDIGAKIGVALLSIPLLLHFYPSFELHVLGNESVAWDDFTFEIAEYGKWAVIMAALMSPYCFAPRPFLRSIVRPAPLVISVFVGIVGAIILRQHYAVGMELASMGLGVDIGPAAPSSHIALFVMALGTVTWTLVSTIGAQSESRRRIGVGIALVVAGGYSFAWPFESLLGLVGLLTISDAARKVVKDERALATTQSFRNPPVAADVWQRYLAALLAGLRDAAPKSKPTTATVRGEDGVSCSHVVSVRDDVSIHLRVDRVKDAVLCIDILCGRVPASGVMPAWTLYARPNRLLGARPHDEPPRCDGTARKADDGPFDARFRVRDAADHTTTLLDDGLRARATALLDGWVAYWPDRALQYRVYPGRGAPLDHPIPITELSFRGASAAPDVERLVTVVDLIAEMATRGGLCRTHVGTTAEMAVRDLGLDEPPAKTTKPDRLHTLPSAAADDDET